MTVEIESREFGVTAEDDVCVVKEGIVPPRTRNILIPPTVDKHILLEYFDTLEAVSM